MTNPSSLLPWIVGNWKMYKTAEEAATFLDDLLPKVQDASCPIFLAVPFTAIQPCAKKTKGTIIQIGAQNMSDASEGAFTGEIAGRMLKEAGASFVLLGHSERRRYFQENNAFIQRKVKRALEDQLLPILCIGETAKEKEDGQTKEVLKTQIQECLANISLKEQGTLVLAYEPVWAIGTGLTASKETIQETLTFCQQCLIEQFGEPLGKTIPLLYGGSVQPETVASLLQQEQVGGLLVGGASLSIETFVQIIDNVKNIHQ